MITCEPGTFSITIEPAPVGVGYDEYIQALEVTRHITDVDYRCAAIRGIIAARMQEEINIRNVNVPNDDLGRAMLNQIMRDLTNDAVTRGIIGPEDM